MQLLLIRHADAEDTASTDFDRALTPKGHKQARALGAYLQAIRLRPTRILTSPLVRARQTAEHIESATHSEYGLLEDNRLACGCTPHDACDILLECDAQETVILVGHQPDMGHISATLLGMNFSGNIEFKKASTAIFLVDRPAPGAAQLTAFLPVKLLFP